MQSNNPSDLIDSYVLHTMDESERKTFEHRLKADATLSREMTLTAAIVAGIVRRAEKLRLMAQMREAVNARSRTLQAAIGKVRRMVAKPLRVRKSVSL